MNGLALSSRDPVQPSRFPNGRRCAHEGCSTPLSAYNPGRTCWLHSPAKYPRNLAPRKPEEPADNPRLCHGTTGGYARGCHCNSCRGANSAYHRQWLARRETT